MMLFYAGLNEICSRWTEQRFQGRNKLMNALKQTSVIQLNEKDAKIDWRKEGAKNLIHKG